MRRHKILDALAQGEADYLTILARTGTSRSQFYTDSDLLLRTGEIAVSKVNNVRIYRLTDGVALVYPPAPLPRARSTKVVHGVDKPLRNHVSHSLDAWTGYTPGLAW